MIRNVQKIEELATLTDEYKGSPSFAHKVGSIIPSYAYFRGIRGKFVLISIYR